MSTMTTSVSSMARYVAKQIENVEKDKADLKLVVAEQHKRIEALQTQVLNLTDTVTRAQQDGTKLVLENRDLRDKVEELVEDNRLKAAAIRTLNYQVAQAQDELGLVRAANGLLGAADDGLNAALQIATDALRNILGCRDHALDMFIKNRLAEITKIRR